MPSKVNQADVSSAYHQATMGIDQPDMFYFSHAGLRKFLQDHGWPTDKIERYMSKLLNAKEPIESPAYFELKRVNPDTCKY